MKTNWQKRRSEFNHDWMKNKYLQAIRSWLRLMGNTKVVYKALEEKFISDTLPQWEDHVDEAFALPKDFEREMSPIVLFTEPPLSSCDTDTKRCLGELIHALWIEKYHVNTLVADALSRAQMAHHAYNRIHHELKNYTDTRSAQALQPMKPLFDDFCVCCQTLAAAIEKFPSEIKVI